MISGEFTSISILSITIDRPNRIRKEMSSESISSLSESIARLGLLHPPVVTRERVLVAGETRLEACKALGWSHIPVQFVDDLSPQELLAIELEENVKRKDISWQEQCDAVRRYHELKQETEGTSWTQEQTAEAIGLARTTVSNYLAVAEEVQKGNAKVLAAKEYSVALGVTKRTRERNAADETSLLMSTTADVPFAPPVQSDTPILTDSFLDWVESYTGPPFNLIHCDFPYGINADKFNQGAADAYGAYDDSPDVYWELVDCLIRNREKLLGASGHIIFWFSMRFYTETLLRLREVFWVEPYPLVWFKSDNKGTLPDPSRGPRRVYEVAFFCSLGDRKILSAVANTFAGPVLRTSEHMSEKSEPMLSHFLRMVVDENTRLLDPTCGSGSALRAAHAMGASYVLGLELNPEFAENARRVWRERNG